MDTDLVARAQDGDEAAFRELTLAVAPRFLRVAVGILRDAGHAEDATQQALVRMWRQLSRLRDPARFEAWSYRLLVNACYTEARRVRPADGPAALSFEPAAPEQMGVVIDRDQLERGFRRLSLEQRAVVVLHLYLGLSHAETGAALGIPEGTVRSRLYHGIQGMRAALAADARPATGFIRPEEATR